MCGTGQEHKVGKETVKYSAREKNIKSLYYLFLFADRSDFKRK